MPYAPPTPEQMLLDAEAKAEKDSRSREKWLAEEDDRWSHQILRWTLRTEGEWSNPLRELQNDELERHLADGWQIISPVMREQYGSYGFCEYVYLKAPA